MKKILLIVLFCVASYANAVTIYAAASTRDAMGEIIQEFEKQNPDVKMEVYFGASGKGFAQFQHGFKYDIFLSADTQYPQAVVDAGEAISEVIVFATGALALYSLDPEMIKKGFDGFSTADIKNISIANPRLAPYGKAAVEAMQSHGVHDLVRSKIVTGENISQSVHFVDSGAADIGLVAFSLIALSADNANYTLVDQKHYTPIKQGFVLTHHAKGNENAKKFADFITGEYAQKTFQKYGFGKAL